ncbi:uncharacterized protein LOC132946224 [Metopolophium dirhodum]|uniref:uncharacterized protein LOC132946224 n=1 Tax=Metopolophium dirhodum TaxID=44670 RepID=UPI0029907C34|nr:uncharacterized protein LOC132946224 [Metopolophium dirhodum]
MILIKLYICIGFIFVSNAQSLFRPNLPLGKYRMVFNAIRQCEDSKHLPMQVHLYLNKKSSNITELRGNFTVGGVIFDDSLVFDGNAASWGSTGGWKTNSIVYVATNACSKAKFLLGNAWYTFQKAFNIPSGDCPVPMGTYSTSTGYDTALLEDSNFPKVYFYGKYKYVGKVKTKDNKLLGCVAYEVELLRPWEV